MQVIVYMITAQSLTLKLGHEKIPAQTFNVRPLCAGDRMDSRSKDLYTAEGGVRRLRTRHLQLCSCSYIGECVSQSATLNQHCMDISSLPKLNIVAI